MNVTTKHVSYLGALLTLLSAASVHGATTTGSSDFATRCQAPGVLVCVGFDTTADLSSSQLYPGNDGQIHGTLDTSTSADGAGSLKFTLPAAGAANAAGYWTTSLGAKFGPGTTFYVQFRQRFSPEILQSSNGGGGNKQVIFHDHSATCGNVEITTNNAYWRGFPQMYSQCGQDGFYTAIAGGDYLLQDGADLQCHYQSPVSRTPPCGYYQTNNWMTFYYKVTVGDWGQPTSSIEAWLGYEGDTTLRQFISEPNHVLYENYANDGTLYDTITLLPYDTGRSSAATDSYTWYDSLIISTQPIAPPGGSVAPKPSPPTNVIAQ